MKLFTLLLLSVALNCGMSANDQPEPVIQLPTQPGHLTILPQNNAFFGDRSVAMGTKGISLSHVTAVASPDQDLTVSGMNYNLTMVSWNTGFPARSVPSALLNVRISVDAADYTGTLHVTIGTMSGSLSNIIDGRGNALVIPKGQTKEVGLIADVNTWPELSPFYDGEWRLEVSGTIDGLTYRRPGETTDIAVPVNDPLGNIYALYRSTITVTNAVATNIPGGLSTALFGSNTQVMAQTLTASPQGDAVVHSLLSDWYIENVRHIMSSTPYRIYLVDPSSPSGLTIVGFGDLDAVSGNTDGSYKNILSSVVAYSGHSLAEGIAIPAGTSKTFVTAFSPAGIFSPGVSGSSTFGVRVLGITWSDGTLGVPIPALIFPGKFDPALSYRIITN